MPKKSLSHSPRMPTKALKSGCSHLDLAACRSPLTLVTFKSMPWQSACHPGKHMSTVGCSRPVVKLRSKPPPPSSAESSATVDNQTNLLRLMPSWLRKGPISRRWHWKFWVKRQGLFKDRSCGEPESGSRRTVNSERGGRRLEVVWERDLSR